MLRFVCLIACVCAVAQAIGPQVGSAGLRSEVLVEELNPGWGYDTRVGGLGNVRLNEGVLSGYGNSRLGLGIGSGLNRHGLVGGRANNVVLDGYDTVNSGILGVSALGAYNTGPLAPVWGESVGPIVDAGAIVGGAPCGPSGAVIGRGGSLGLRGVGNLAGIRNAGIRNAGIRNINNRNLDIVNIGLGGHDIGNVGISNVGISNLGLSNVGIGGHGINRGIGGRGIGLGKGGVLNAGY